MKIEGTKRIASIHPLVAISSLGILIAASAGFLFGPGLGSTGTTPTSPDSTSNGSSPTNSALNGLSLTGSGSQNSPPNCGDWAAVVTGFDPTTGYPCYQVAP